MEKTDEMYLADLPDMERRWLRRARRHGAHDAICERMILRMNDTRELLGMNPLMASANRNADGTYTVWLNEVFVQNLSGEWSSTVSPPHLTCSEREAWYEIPDMDKEIQDAEDDDAE